MLVFYILTEFGRTSSVAVHDAGPDTVRIIQTRNGKVTSDRIREFANPGDRAGYFADLDARMTAARFRREQ